MIERIEKFFGLRLEKQNVIMALETRKIEVNKIMDFYKDLFPIPSGIRYDQSHKMGYPTGKNGEIEVWSIIYTPNNKTEKLTFKKQDPNLPSGSQPKYEIHTGEQAGWNKENFAQKKSGEIDMENTKELLDEIWDIFDIISPIEPLTEEEFEEQFGLVDTSSSYT